MERAWQVEHVVGSAADLHAASAELVANPGPRRVRVLEATGPAVVLGSAEPEDHVDRARAERLGYLIARRRSGGGAVLVGPRRALWIDVVVPQGDPLWLDDVQRAGWWLGDRWVAALAAVGLPGGVTHRGPMRRTRWSDRVCFAGLGPGEVVDAGGAKVVGVAQRRTRHAALFQCAVAEQPGVGWSPWDPAPLLDVLALPPGEREEAAGDLAGAALAVGDAPSLQEAVVAELVGLVP